MSFLSRRTFLGTAAASFAGAHLLRAEDPTDPPTKAAPDNPPFEPNTLFLTWQRDPTTTMTVQWIGVTGETSDTKVYYATDPKGPFQSKETTTRKYPMTDFKVFRAELTDLKPGTDYWFRTGRSSVKRFRTMPAKATDTIEFISGGDCGVNTHAIANNIQAAKQDPMFAVIGGDLGYDNGKAVDVSLAFLRNYSKTMVAHDGRLIPLIAAIGNHEVEGGYNKPRTKAPFFYALFDGLYPETGYATLDFGDYLSLVLLDSGHTSPIAGAQTDWLEKALRERADRPHVMAVNHVPAYPSYRASEGAKGKGGTGEGNRKHWVPLFQKYRLPVVLEHHDHTFKRTKPLIDGMGDDHGVLFLGDGSWGRLRSPQSPEKLSYLAAASHDYHLSLHRLQGASRYHIALDEFGRAMDVCKSGQRLKGMVPVKDPA